VQVHVTNPARFKPFLTGLALIDAARGQAPRLFAWRRPPYEFERRRLPIDILCGTDRLRRALQRRVPLHLLERSWQPDLRRWARKRARWLLYE
jgi:uncharacterized protein YbbC (DUF1343 family)